MAAAAAAAGKGKKAAGAMVGVKRKPEGGGEGRGKGGGGGGEGGKDLQNKQFRPAAAAGGEGGKTQPKQHDGKPQEKDATESRQDQKAAKVARKAKRKPNFELIHDASQLWEKVRSEKTPAAERTALVGQLLQKLKGKLSELAVSHTASRVVQTCLKHGTPEARATIYAELQPHAVVLSKNVYAHFLVGKLLDYGTKEQQQQLRKLFNGHPILEKGIIDHSLLHHVLMEYLPVATQGSVEDIVNVLAGPLLMRMVHTKDGARVGLAVINSSTAKHRKKIVKGMKGLVARMCRDEHGHLIVMRLLDVMDDTTLLNKVLVSEILKELRDIVHDKRARLVVLRLLAPACTRYFSPNIQELLQRQVAPIVNPKVNNAAVAEGDSDDDDEQQQQEQHQSVSKKDPEVRRVELLSELAQPLSDLCADQAGDMLRSPTAGDVLYEVMAGSARASTDAVTAVQQAVADAAAEEPGTSDAAAAEECAMEHFYGSRLLRRLVLAPRPAHTDCEPFAAVLWRRAFQGRCERWAKGHSAKVVAAVYTYPHDAQVTKAAEAELRPLFESGQVDESLFKKIVPAEQLEKHTKSQAEQVTKQPKSAEQLAVNDADEAALDVDSTPLRTPAKRRVKAASAVPTPASTRPKRACTVKK
eukprot:jgi/Chlat1/3521/Chrsp23S03795